MAGKPRPAHTPRAPGADSVGGARAGGPLRSAAGLLHDPDSFMDAGRLTDRSGHGDPLSVVSVEVSRARARLTILGAIPSVLASSPPGMVADDLVHTFIAFLKGRDENA